MKVSEQWLREWINPDIDTETLIEQLTTAGLEVSSVIPVAEALSGVIVGEIMDVKSHPDADRLYVCQVSDGNQVVQVVCGASNVHVGLKVPFAQVNARLRGDIKISKVKLRGIESSGMLCSAQELGVEGGADGLLELQKSADVGKAVNDYLQLDDQIIEIDLTPNRGDCLSILGVAREVAMINDIIFEDREMAIVPAAIDDIVPVTLSTPDDCPVYTCRVVRGINAKAETPLWMREKLRCSGLHAISPVVDITNYILLELGQPMHAFDLSKLSGGVDVRRAKQGESLILLDGKMTKLNDDVLVIADQNQALAMAGIIGGKLSSVTDSTTDILLESAYFNPLTISGRARRFGVHTDSSHRFERGVDPQLQKRAIERATALLLDICGGAAGPVQRACDIDAMPQRKEIRFRSERAQQLLGISLDDGQIERYFKRLQISYTGGQGEWQCIAPSYRFDIRIEADLIEEIARLYGYNNIPQTSPEVPQVMMPKPEYVLGLDSLKDVLMARGWQEAVTYSFVDPKLQEQLSPDRPAVNLSNPLSREMSQMRTSHWSGLLNALQHNQSHQQKQVRLFEAGLNFIADGDDIDQQSWVSGVATGSVWPEQWSVDSRMIDFYDVKNDLEALFDHGRNLPEFSFEAEPHPALHPGQSARVYRDGEAVGWLGALHPEIAKSMSFDDSVILFEIKALALTVVNPRQFIEISRFPVNRRDLAIIVDESVTCRDILETIKNIGDETISQAWVFDVYRGGEIKPEQKSITLGLILSSPLRTLGDIDTEAVISKIIRELREKLNATLRD